MTEQPKLIESVEEAKQAIGNTQRLLKEGWANCDISYTPFDELISLIDHGKLRWKPEEWEYVTVESFRLDAWMLGEYEIASMSGVWSKLPRDFSALNVEALLINQKIRRKKVEGGGEIELVEIENTSTGWTYFNELKDVNLNLPHLKRTGRTVKGVIHE